MSSGMNIYNAQNELIVTSESLPSLVLAAQGSVAATVASTGHPGFIKGKVRVNFPGSVQNPILFARSTAGASFCFWGVDTGGFWYGSQGVVDYRVYSFANVPSVPPSNDSFGLELRNSLNKTFFSSRLPPPQILTYGVAWSGSPRPGHVGQILSSFSVPAMAFDGKYPFVSASAASAFFTVFAGQVGVLPLIILAKFSGSALTFEVGSSGNMLPPNAPEVTLRQFPRPFLIVR